ncbi:MAG: AAA family ATPase [Treponema sp.]|nr:AAA family ATPase [Treponema sp.]
MFTGRDKELKELKAQFESSEKTFVCLYGKKGQGKTSLLSEALKSFEGIVINHQCAKTSYEGNVFLLNASISQALKLEKPLQEKSLEEIFNYLKSQDKKIILIINEYRLLRNTKREREIDLMIHCFVEEMPANIKVVLCESYIPEAESLMEEQNPLSEDFSMTQGVKEFNYLEASAFYSRYNVRDKIQFYSVFGGSPYVLSKLDYWKSLEDNVIRLLLDRNGELRLYLEQIVLADIQKYFDVRILQILAEGKKRYKEILDTLEIEDSGLLDKQLKILLGMDVIVKAAPINKTDDRKKQFYDIKDNLLRFYFLYVFGKEALIYSMGEKKYFRQNILPQIEAICSSGFKGIEGEYFFGKTFGSFWYDSITSKESRQIECVMETENGHELYVVNNRKKPMTLIECQTAETQIRDFLPNSFSKINFVCSAGFAFESEVYTLISGKEIYLVKSR